MRSKNIGTVEQKKGTRLARWNKSNLNAEQKYRDRGSVEQKIETRLARRNKSNLNAEQKYKDQEKRKKASAKEQIEYKCGTKI
jgi:hypothetical protein